MFKTYQGVLPGGGGWGGDGRGGGAGWWGGGFYAWAVHVAALAPVVWEGRVEASLYNHRVP